MDDNNLKQGGIKDFIAHTSAIGNVIIGAASTKNSSEPLPFTDRSQFEEDNNALDINCLRINVNLHVNPKRIFIPKTPIEVDVVGERKHGAHFMHPYNYTLTFKHGLSTWQVVRSYKDIKEVHKTLAKLVKEDLGQSCSDISKEDIEKDWPMFPTEHDHLITESQIGDRCQKLAEYLRRLLTYPPFRDHPATLNLLSVSPLSFIIDLGVSLIEGLLQKRSGDNIYYGRFSRLKICCDRVKILHINRWFCLKDTYLVYLNPIKNYECGYVMLADQNFQFKKGVRAGAVYSISIKNSQRSLVLKCKNQAQQLEWYEKIDQMTKNEAKLFCNPTSYSSFAPLRDNQKCKWYVNAAGYMEAVLNGLNAAKEEIFITDWWLCPELFLKRPTNDLQYRLDKVLAKKAKEGVKVYILLFKEVQMALGLKSLRAKQVLTSKNPNIKVIRHPEHTPSGIFMWSHHEKMVIIDQSVAFMGGIDLCFGRWDDDLHRLVDLGKTTNITEINKKDVEQPISPAQDENAETIGISGDQIEYNKSGTSELNDNMANTLLVAALMGNFTSKLNTKHLDLSEKLEKKVDIKQEAAFTSLSDQSIKHGTKNVVSRNKAKLKLKLTSKKRKYEINSKGKNYIDQYDNILPSTDNDMNTSIASDLDNTKRKVKRKWNRLRKNVNRKIKTRSDHHTDSDDDESENESEDELKYEPVDLPVISNEGYYWVGKDYANNYKEDFKNVEEFSKDQFDRKVMQRMPWRDEALVVFGESARDLARHFIQRWNQCKREKVNRNDLYPYLLPKEYKNGYSYNYDWFKESLFTCDVQMLRSLEPWSGGITQAETSIMNAYESLIDVAEHYIYIENQFFVTTGDPQNDTEVKNVVGRALVSRIKRAKEKNQKFRVYVVLPLLPGFDSQNAIQAVQYYNLRSINLGKYSIYEELKRSGISDPSEYITFHGMRNWSVLMGKLVQEIIYVHSKLLIVDDKYVLCGSANINDRSLIGKRDSEIAAVIKDKEFISGKFDNQKVSVGKYAHSLRIKLFKLHLGIYFQNPNKVDVTDCVCDEFYNLFRSTSKKNTETYDEVFKCIPSDNILTFIQLRTYLSEKTLSRDDPHEGKIKLENDVKGFLVDFPLKFLSNEKSFFPDLNTAEGIVPVSMWT